MDPELGDAASLVAAGMLAPVSEALFGEGALLRVNLLAVARFGSFAAELEEATGHQVGLRREGTLAVAYDPGDYAALVRLTAFRRSAGLDAEELDSRACRKLESFLTPDVHGGVLFAGDWSVDNRRYAAALRAAAAAAGVRVVRDRVTEVLLRDGQDRRRPGSRTAATSARARWWWPPAAGPSAIAGVPAPCGPRCGRSRASCCGCGTRTACRRSSPTRSGPPCAARTSTWCRGPTARSSWAPLRKSAGRTGR